MQYPWCGWILPDGTTVACEHWFHLETAKQLPFVLAKRETTPCLQQNWDDREGEDLRRCLAGIGLVKVHENLVDADEINLTQLVKLQKIYEWADPNLDIDIVGRIQLKIPARLFLKIRNPDRLNALG